jgi:hypothetical protein
MEQVRERKVCTFYSNSESNLILKANRFLKVIERGGVIFWV